MNFKRWYDKYPELKSMLDLLETVNERDLSMIADDFLQIILSKYGSEFDETIRKLSENAPPAYGRWYDEDYNLHTCIEFLKLLDEPRKKEMIDLYIMSILSFVNSNEQQ